MLWKSVVGKLWMTIIGLVALILMILGVFLLPYIDVYHFKNSYDVKRLFVFTGIVGFSLTTVFAFFLFYKITQPLRMLKKAADRIRKGEYNTDGLNIRSTDEIGELAHTFSHMAKEMQVTIQDLNHEKEHLSSILRSMTDAVITFDAEGKVVLANPRGEDILRAWNDLSWDGDMAERDDDGFHIPEPLLALFQAVLETRSDLTDKLHVQQGVFSVVMAPLHSQESVRGAVAVLRDVTEEVKLEKLRKDFVANVSHEIRTPLSMLQGYSEALMDDIAASPEERQELVQVIHDESLRMGRLVKDLLDLARMEAGHIEMQHESIQVDQLIQRVYRKFAVLAKERDIQLLLEASSEPMILEAADEDRLEQVLTNLLDNAFRHTNAGLQILLSAGYTKTSKGRVLVLKIADQGQGIPSEDVPFIFERFYKADKARTRGTNGGTGLGLAIVKNIVDAHHATIAVQSTVGQGTTFTITFPVEI
ncbi:ATP-binding protein [Paenibacillus terrigena]|uniref:HAMP domain-containing sensor histidine kinase n=1 Tax=Paenibacillus terrigena TaxID=369333 RepID=UPI0028D13E1D|nr:ATP-binding protein [Paenibacillus terrigena]